MHYVLYVHSAVNNIIVVTYTAPKLKVLNSE